MFEGLGAGLGAAALKATSAFATFFSFS